MKVVFLDFNGVLDTYDNMDEINFSNLKRLKHIIDETNSKVVISSSKKDSYYYTGHLSESLLSIIRELEKENIEVIGITPKATTREQEIQLYLDLHPDIENFCIIDDDYEMESFKDNIVKLPSQMEEGQMGLDDYHMNMAIEILKTHNKKIYK